MAYNFLIVDDSAIVHKVIIKTLGLAGIETSALLEAPNGQVALEKIRGTWVDLVFLDINMPVMNGVEFMQKLRDDALYKDLPVVIVSTEGSKERRELLDQMGIKAYLRKPVTPEALSATVTEILGELKHE